MTYTIEDKDNSLIVTIPSRKNWLLISLISFSSIFSATFLILVVGFALFMISIVGFQVAEKQSIFEGVEATCLILLFFVPMLLVVVSVTASALYAVLWYVSGKEVIKISPHLLTIQREIFGISFPKKYHPRHVRNLRVLPQRESHLTNYFFLGSLWVLLSIPKGKIAFDHPFGTYHFGISLEPDAASEIIAIIKENFPGYGKT